LAQRLAIQLRAAFSAVFMPNLDPKELDKRLNRVCIKAAECALLVRRSKATYLWLQASELERARGDEIELVGARLGGTKPLAADEECEVVFTAFGALVKDDVEIKEGESSIDCITLRKPRVVAA
jgi:hypothetical protein